MGASHEHPAGEELARHAGWIRALARSLVGDDATADDVVQDTWVAALSRRAPGGRRLRPWLATVARNAARQDRRRRLRREARERSRAESGLPGSLPGGVPGPDEWSERLEMERLVTERLARLPEPFRSTLLMRYYEDLQPIEIARRLGIPDGTARWRLKRGLELLREGLDEAHGGDRRAWTLALLPLARGGAAATGAVAGPSLALSGALAMNGMLKLGVAAAAVVVLAVGLTRTGAVEALLPELFEEPAEVAFRPQVAEPAEPEPELAEAPAPVTAVVGRELQPVAPPAEAPEEAAPPAPAEVEVRVLDRLGSPLAGVRVRFEASASPDEAAATTGADGRAVAGLETGESERVDLTLSALGFATKQVEVVARRGERTHAGSVTLEPGGSVAGRVVDPEGFPVPGARIALSDPEVPRRALSDIRYFPPLVDVPRAGTNEHGEFVLTGVPVGVVRLWAMADGRRNEYSAPVEVRAGQESSGVEIVLTPLEKTNLIAGIVVDPAGNPVPGAALEWRHESRSSGRTIASQSSAEDDGTFSFELAEDARLWITASDPEERLAPASASDVRTGTLDLVLQLTEVRLVEIVARDPDGEPIERYGYEIRTADEETRLGREPRAELPEGRTAFRLPTAPFLVTVDAPGYALASAGPFDPGRAPTQVTVRPEPLPGLRGVVLADGEPVAGAEVFLHAMIPEDASQVRNGFRVRSTRTVSDQTTTDGEGRFLLTVRAEDDYVVRVERDGYAPAEWGPARLGPALATDEIQVALGPGGSIEGRLQFEDGRDPAGAIVGLSRADGYGRTVRVQSDGSYRFERLTPGPWLVVLRDEEVFQGRTNTTRSQGNGVVPFEDEVEWSCEVWEGRTTYHDLFAGQQGAFRFEGRLTIDGVPAAGWVARLAPPGVLDFDGGPAATLGPDGRFSISTTGSGPRRLLVGAPGAADVERFLVDEVEVPSDEPWELELATSTLVVEGAPPWDGEGIPSLVLVWEGPGRCFGLLPVAGDAGGTCRLEDAFAGATRLTAPDPERIHDPLSWTPTRTVLLPPGGEARVDLR